MAGLNLTPNEVVGYRIKAEYLNWTVVLVKKKGEQSRLAGAEYETPVGYYKSIEAAALAIVTHEAQRLGEELQADALREHGTVADARAIVRAFEKAAAAAREALAQVHADVLALAADEEQIRRRMAAARAADQTHTA